ncbi:hypothetical protein QYE76_042714 [Lolium multiflorum]|uniref:Uncharacterized protein n=1 Tax=Lolium multiflorum TaxID=4521 RepID=A0AAD8THQ4_LOLMU|nr:hypothetical protein QYE76_042714 [Lolium multiflorum]
MLCEGHLGICPDIRLWQFFFRVKKDTKDKAMVNCGSMTFMLRPQRMYPPHSSHESVRYWNAGWFYVKNIKVSDVHEGLPKFIDQAPEETASWIFIPALAQFPELDKAALRISWLVQAGLTRMDLTLSWFTRRIQPLKYNKRMICEYSGFEDQLRVTRDNVSMDSLNKRIWTLVKITRGQEVPEICKDIITDNKCPPLNTLAKENFRTVIRVPASADGAEEDPEDDDEEEEEQAPKKAASRTAKRPRAKASGSEAGANGEASAKKAKTKPPPRLDSKKAERGRSCSATKRAAPEEPQDNIPEEAEVTSHDKAEASAKDAVGFPANFVDPSNLYSTPKAYSHKFFHKLTELEKWELEQDMLNNAWGKADVDSSEIQLHKKEISDFFDQLLVKRKRCVTLNQADDIQSCKEKNADLEKQLAEAQGASSSLATASSELENLRSAYKDLETKLTEADRKRESAEKQLAEKNSEFHKKEADFVIKWKVDSDTLKKLQNEVHGLRNYMTTAEKCWDHLNADVMEPLGYNEDRRNQFPRDDPIQLVGDDSKDLISACRKICHNLAIPAMSGILSKEWTLSRNWLWIFRPRLPGAPPRCLWPCA